MSIPPTTSWIIFWSGVNTTLSTGERERALAMPASVQAGQSYHHSPRYNNWFDARESSLMRGMQSSCHECANISTLPIRFVCRCELQPLSCNPQWVAHLGDSDAEQAARASATESKPRRGRARAKRRKAQSRQADGEF